MESRGSRGETGTEAAAGPPGRTNGSSAAITPETARSHIVIVVDIVFMFYFWFSLMVANANQTRSGVILETGGGFGVPTSVGIPIGISIWVVIRWDSK